MTNEEICTMRLSDAIAMGRVLVSELKAGSMDGCVLGMAAKAIGTPTSGNMGDCFSKLERQWPWLRNEVPEGVVSTAGNWTGAIWYRFDIEVMIERTLTLDQLIDWVRTIEPPETVGAAPTNPDQPVLELMHFSGCNEDGDGSGE